jgi:hypothetical protein
MQFSVLFLSVRMMVVPRVSTASDFLGCAPGQAPHARARIAWWLLVGTRVAATASTILRRSDTLAGDPSRGGDGRDDQDTTVERSTFLEGVGSSGASALAAVTQLVSSP